MQVRSETRTSGADSGAIEQLDALTSLRFFAALYVLLFHFAVLFPGTLDNVPAIGLGFSGVTFFFILSGFILAHNYSGSDVSRPERRRAYFVARIARIAPVFLLSLFVALPSFSGELARTSDQGLLTLRIWGGILAPFGLHAWLPGAACSINCPSWSISAELFFYLLLPIVLSPIMTRPWRWLAAIVLIWIGLALAAAAIWNHFGNGHSVISAHQTAALAAPAQLLKHFPLLRLPEFLLGIAAYALWRRHGNVDTGRHALLVLGAATMAVIAALPLIPEIALHNGFTALFWTPLIIWAANARGGMLCHRMLMFLGRISFSIYLLHFPIGLLVLELGAIWPDHPLAGSPALGLAVAMGATLLLSALVFTWIEEPCRRLISRWLRSPQRYARGTSPPAEFSPQHPV